MNSNLHRTVILSEAKNLASASGQSIQRSFAALRMTKLSANSVSVTKLGAKSGILSEAKNLTIAPRTHLHFGLLSHCLLR